MKKKSISYADLSKKQLQHLKELYIQKKVECMSHKELKEFVLEHSNETGSSLSKKIIDDFENELKNFVQVCPKEMIDKLENPISTKTKIKKVS